MKRLILIAIIIALLIPIGSRAETESNELSVLYSIMDDLGGNTREEDIVFNGVILDKFIKQDEMELIGEEIKSQIGLLGIEVDPLINEEHTGEYHTKEIIFEEDFGQICYVGKDKNNNNIVIILNSYNNQEELTEETYLFINIIKDSDFLKKNDIIEEVKSIYSIYNCKVEITSCLIGEFSKEMSYNNRVEEIEKALKKINGNVVEEFSDTYLISYTVYTPYIDEYIKIGKDKINLNIAIRQSELDGKSYIWVATPIIAIGY